MSDVALPTRVSRFPAHKLRIGMLRLTDAAPVIVAHEFGFFADEGIEAALVVEPSWANIADKLAFGILDAAVIVPPLVFAIDLGLRGVAQPLIVPYAISLGGNTVTLARDLADETREQALKGDLSMAEGLEKVFRERKEVVTLGVVHAYSTHNLMLRYWLATAGIFPDQTIKLAVVPPALAVEALGTKRIVGFCAGAPWGEVARRAGVGATIAASGDIWGNAPEKVLAVRARWIDEAPGALTGVLRALLRASDFCDQPQNASYVAALLSRGKYLNLDSHAILGSLPGGAGEPSAASSFFRNAATFPWRSHALWFLNEMTRWGLLEKNYDLRALAFRVYRPDLYRAAAETLSLPTPLADEKREGAHAAAWALAASSGFISMGSDLFCDGVVFDPAVVDRAVHNS